MIKKLFSFIFCLAPVGAMAEPVALTPADSGPNISSTGINVGTSGNTIIISSRGQTGDQLAKTLNVTTGGIRVIGNMTVGTYSGTGTGALYVLGETFTPADSSNTFYATTSSDIDTGFTITSADTINIGGVLQVDQGNFLTMGQTGTAKTNLILGSGTVAVTDTDSIPGIAIYNAGKLALTNIDVFTTAGTIRNTVDAQSLTINAASFVRSDTVAAMSFENTGGIMDINVGTSDMDLGTGTIISSQAATQTNITAGALTSGDIENGGTGTMNVLLTGDLTTSGSIRNISGNEMTVKAFKADGATTAPNIKVTGAIANLGSASELTIVTDGDLTVNGQYSGNPQYGNASIVTGGDLFIDVGGTTTLANGFDFSTMTAANTFELKTGSLVVGNDDATHWLSLFSNKLNTFVVNITNDELDLGDARITNVTEGDIAANMTINATNVTTTGNVTNNGALLAIALPTVDTEGNTGFNPITGKISVGNIDGNSGTTILNAGGTLIAGRVNNSATMNLSGEAGTTLVSVTNSGTLTVSSSTSTGGNLTVGDITNNNGTATFTSRITNITGSVRNNGGNLSIQGSDGGTATDGTTLLPITIAGALKAAGGQTTLNALAGKIAVNGGLSVTSGGLNLGNATTNLDVTGAVDIAKNITLSTLAATETVPAGNMNISNSGNQKFVLTSTNGITVDGDILATKNDLARTAQFVAKNATNGTVQKIKVGTPNANGNITTTGRGHLIFGDATNQSELVATGTVSATKDASNNVGSIEFYGNQTTVGAMTGNGLFIAHGTIGDNSANTSITATTGNINIADAIYFNNPATDPATGLIVKDTKNFTLTTDNGKIDVGGIELATGNTLKLVSADNLAVTGTIENNGALELKAEELALLTQNLTNNGNVKIDAATINMGDITNNGTADLVATNIRARDITANANSTMTITADDLAAREMNIVTNGVINLAAADATFTDDITVNGNMVQGTLENTDGALNIISATNLDANSLRVTDSFVSKSGIGVYQFKNNVAITNDINITGGQAYIFAESGRLTAKNVNNAATLTLAGGNGIAITEDITSTGKLTLDSGNGLTTANTISWTGTTTLLGAGTTTPDVFTQNMLYQNYGGALTNRDVNIISSDYTITTSDVELAGIAQTYGHITLNTSNLITSGDIDATDLRVAANPATTWLTVDVGGNLSGNTKFVGLQQMDVGGNYIYNSNSGLIMSILPYATGENSTTRNYWATISTTEDGSLGQITNGISAKPLISVGGTFITQLDNNLNPGTGLLTGGEMGIDIYDMIDQGTAIWLLNANGGIREEGTKIRNVVVKFCNADGTQCFDYFKPAVGLNETGTDLPAYISVRDTTSDGTADSLYLVFDPRFSGPVEVFKIQPIVGREEDHTKNEYLTAGALDDMIAGGLADAKFYNRTPIDAIPVAFAGTNMETAAKEIYNRMEYYTETRDGRGLARISRLFQPREIEQMAGSVVLNEHTSFRDFEDHMLDEFIWNRNRNLRKAWGEFDFGLARQKVADDKRVSANRFSFTGGYDWQETNTLILGLAARVSHTSGDNDDHMDLSYLPGQSVTGNVRVDVSDTDFGLGAYMLQNLGTKMRVYGNAFLDLHWLDVTRDQTYMASISGDGTAFSLISEWGLMHDWLNQYIVGNAYVRAGYNFGFSLTEKAAGDDYMKLKSDGYFIVTPGYTLTAQKRIYPSPWFQMRPYASVGVEYDVLGAPDNAKYKFAAAHNFTKYDIDIDPLWANIGGGMEFLSVTGVQVGLDYRYQYNADIQMHKIKLSGSYRF